MPKPRHDNPRAERLIVEYSLQRWRSQRELAREAAKRARVEKLAAELRSVPWDDLTPAELAFRFVLQAADVPGHSAQHEWSRWCAAVRDGSAALEQARSEPANDSGERAEEWRHMTAAERSYANWAENKP